MSTRIFLITLGLLSMLSPISAMAAGLNDAEKAIIEKSVKARLKDPDSARFKWLPIKDGQPVAEKGKTLTYCGKVNSKNSFGGYTGDAPYSVFLVWPKDSPVISAVIGIGTSDWKSPASQATIKICNGAGYTDFFLAK